MRDLRSIRFAIIFTKLNNHCDSWGNQLLLSSFHYSVIVTRTHTLSLSSRVLRLAALFCLLHALSACSSHAPLSTADIISIPPDCNIDEGSTIGPSKFYHPRLNVQAHCHVYDIQWLSSTFCVNTTTQWFTSTKTEKAANLHLLLLTTDEQKSPFETYK